jgi:hypothetical protein
MRAGRVSVLLKMMCPNCHELIVSSLLAEIDEISCQHCDQGVPVRNVLISARGMTINRDDLLKRFFRYKQLLMEIVEERESMDDGLEISESSRKSADQFIETLEELMAGARDHFRLNFSITVPVRLNIDGKLQSGWLVNLSMVGACIETENIFLVPPIGSIVSMEFSLPGHGSTVSMQCMIAWVRSAGKEAESIYDIGVKFLEVEETVQQGLWHLISASVHNAMSV